MLNYPVKFALMCAPYQALSPQAFLDHSPAESLRLFKSVLPQRLHQVVEFAFTDTAILLVLEHETEVDIPRRELIFTKASLNADSWLYANGLTEVPTNPTHEALYETLTEALWKAIDGFETTHTALDDRVHLRRELKALFALYDHTFSPQHPNSLSQLNSRAGLIHFMNLLVAQALYKTDAARALFGPQSSYTRAWQAKQQEFFHYARYLEATQLSHLTSVRRNTSAKKPDFLDSMDLMKSF